MLRRSELKRRTPLRQVSLRRVGIAPARRTTPTGPDAHTVDAVLARDGWCCAVGGCAISGPRGIGWAVHHRRPRRMGGSVQPDTNLPSNLLTVCTPCHELVESRRAEAIERGWLLHAGDVPSQSPVRHMLLGWVYLTDDGRFELAPPPVLRGEVIDLGGYWDGA